MPNETTMTIDERRKYLLIMRQRYVLAERPERGQLLDEMVQVTALHRKSLLRLLAGDLTRQPRARERARTYGAPVVAALRVIAESFDYLCAERLTPNLGWMARQLVQHGELTVSDAVLAQLEAISTSTVQRLLDQIRQDERRLPQKGPERANQVLRAVPMTRIAWDIQEPGHFETDLVHHCGREASGEYLHTLQMIDVATGWSERMAVLGRSYLVMQAAFRRGLARLPFAVLEIHPDNGSEFFNQHMVRFWQEVVSGATLSRSRPYQKNDNRNVEQKNSSLVRAYLGFARLDSARANAGAERTLRSDVALLQPVPAGAAPGRENPGGERRRPAPRPAPLRCGPDALRPPVCDDGAAPQSGGPSWRASATPPTRGACAKISTTAWTASGPCLAPRRG